MKTYWRNFLIGAAGSFVILAMAGTIIDKARDHGDAAGALAELWVYIVLIGIVYSLVMRPWRKKTIQ